ncbi:hypothetical protein J3A83DRAFT_4366767 [Scleroderma citrinum]
MAARTKVFTSEIILKAWKNSGICPLNPHLFKDQDFTPSMSTSTEAHVPSSYPVELHELPDLQDITTDDDDKCSSGSDTDNNDAVSHVSSRSDTDDKSDDEVSTILPFADHCSAPRLAPTSLPIQSSTMPPTVLKSNPELVSYFSSLENRVNQLESRLEEKSGKLEVAKAHCVMALGQIRVLNKQLNSKKGRKF